MSFVRLLVIMLSLFSFITPARADLVKTIERIKSGVVAVGTVQQTRAPPSLFLGSGFVIGNGRYVATNAHVLPALLESEKQETLAVFAGRGKQSEVRSAKKVAVDIEHDLAILEVSGAPLTPLAFGDSASVREGADLAFTGFPIGVVLGLYASTHRATLASISPIVIPRAHSGMLDAKAINRMRNPFDVFQLDAVAYPGNSGSPLYDSETGLVVGIVNMVLVKGSKESALSAPSGIAYAIPVSYLRDLLNSLKP